MSSCFKLIEAEEDEFPCCVRSLRRCTISFAGRSECTLTRCPVEGQELDLTGKEPEVPCLDRAEVP